MSLFWDRCFAAAAIVEQLDVGAIAAADHRELGDLGTGRHAQVHFHPVVVRLERPMVVGPAADHLGKK
jgi:hypothetical protein